MTGKDLSPHLNLSKQSNPIKCFNVSYRPQRNNARQGNKQERTYNKSKTMAFSESTVYVGIQI